MSKLRKLLKKNGVKTKNIKFKKDINAVMHPIDAPIIRDNINIPQKSPRALKKAVNSKPPVTE